jgi:hypothetical protein
MSEPHDTGDQRIISYLTLRQAVGYLGLLLPFVLAIGNLVIFSGGLQESVSDYYYTSMRGVLVGGLCVIGAFLVAYKGYDRWDGLLTNAAGIGAVGVALFPTAPSHPSHRATVVGYFHYAFGAVLFIGLIVIALWLFRKTGPDPGPTREKQLRNRIYLICGIVMVVALALAGVASLPFASGLNSLHPVFWMESVAMAAFAFSWLVKGQAIFRDSETLPDRPLLAV